MKIHFSKSIITTAFIFTCLSLILLTQTSVVYGADALKFEPQIAIPGMSSGPIDVGNEVDGMMTSDLLGKYIQAIYNYGLAITGILAAVILMGAGLLWLTSGGNESKVTQAKDLIIGSITGMVILFGAWMLLNTVNPELLKLRPLAMQKVEAPADDSRYGCCECEITLDIIKTEQACVSNKGFTLSECKTFCKLAGEGVYGTAVALSVAAGSPALHVVKYTETHKFDYQCGDQPETKNTCIQYKTPSVFSSTFDTSGWTFDPNIAAQAGDASPELGQFLNCMRSNLTAGIGRISSISDSGYVGNLAPCNRVLCQPTPPLPSCKHACSSCHYGGGGSGNKSYAVDFGDEENKTKLTTAARNCDNGAYILDEGDHLHISVSNCPKN